MDYAFQSLHVVLRLSFLSFPSVFFWVDIPQIVGVKLVSEDVEHLITRLTTVHVLTLLGRNLVFLTTGLKLSNSV